MTLVEAARSLIGTPYHAKGRLPGVGLDCIGVPIVAAWLAGVKPRSFDVRGYSDVPDGSLLPLCDQHMQRVEAYLIQPADEGDRLVAQLDRHLAELPEPDDWASGRGSPADMATPTPWMGIARGATIIAPITVAVESATTPDVAMTVAKTKSTQNADIFLLVSLPSVRSRRDIIRRTSSAVARMRYSLAGVSELMRQV